MLGRDAEVEQITRAIRRADLVGAVLTGSAGAGKSTLVEHTAALAEHEGFAVVRLFGSRATSTLPLCAFSSFLEPGGEDAAIERFIAIRRALDRHSAGRPLLIAIDDAHLIDDSSAALVGQLARELTAFAVCSLRTGEPAPEPISSLWIQGSAVLIEVGPVPREVAGTIAEDALGGPLSQSLETELWKRTKGNPLFVRELSLGSRASGALAQVDGVWSQTGALVASTALVDAVTQRFTNLTPAEMHTLCCIALSEPVGVEVIERVADETSLIALEEAGLVSVTQDRRRLSVRLTHPLYGDVARSQTSQLRARKIRRALGDAVVGFGARRHEDSLSVASWRLDSGDTDPVQFATAAFDAIRRHDTDLAERLATAAHEHSPSEITARALAMTRHLLGRHGEALDALTQPLIDAPRRSAQWARIGLLDGLVRARGVGDYPGALSVLSEVGASQTSPRNVRRADAMIALIELLQGDAGACRARAGRLVDDGATEAEAYTALVGATAANGRPALAVDIANGFLEQHGEADPRSLFPDFHWVALLDAGELDSTTNQVSEAWENAIDLSDEHRQARAALALGHVLLDRGHAVAARTWFTTAAQRSRTTGERFGERWALSGRLLASAMLSDIADAEQTARDLDAVPSHPAAFFEVYGKRGTAWLTAVGGEPTLARRQLLELADTLIAGGCLSHAVRTLLDVARLGDPAAALARLADIEDELDGRGLLAFIGMARALAAGSAVELMTSSNLLAELGYTLLAAEAASAARDAHAKAGESRLASAWGRRASELIAHTGTGATPMFTVIESIVPLTRREREVAVIVATGMSNREVAEACFLSVRTVETHLARIYDKLGVRTRGELADALSSMMVSGAA